MEGETLSAARVADAGGQVIPGLRPLYRGCYVRAPAFTCTCSPGDNLALHRALRLAPAGVALVCAVAGASDTAYFGELMAIDAKKSGIAGLLLEGAVRDTKALSVMRFPVFCAGAAPGKAEKRSAGSVGEAVWLGGVRVAPGDWIVADADGVVLAPQRDWAHLCAQAGAIDAMERSVRERLGSGERLADLLGLPADSRKDSKRPTEAKIHGDSKPADERRADEGGLPSAVGDQTAGHDGRQHAG